MNYESFHQSLAQSGPPATLSLYLKALWLDGHGDWHAAHNMVNDLEDSTAFWVHAYLHRKEGDIGNAEHWYRRSGKKRPDISLQEEWESIVKDLLSSGEGQRLGSKGLKFKKFKVGVHGSSTATAHLSTEALA